MNPKLILGALIVLGSRLLTGAIIFDNGAPTSDTGPTMTLSNLSDDFALSSAATLRGLQFYATFDVGNLADHNREISFWILNDVGGTLSVVAQGTDTGVNIGSPISISGATLYQFLVNLGGVALGPGDYRLVLRSFSTQAYVRWTATSPGFGSPASFIFFDPGGITMNVLGSELNFQLLDELPAAVPEPAGWPVRLLSVAVGIPVLRRRRLTQQQR